MAFNLTQFRAQMIGDGARPNLFECNIFFPVEGGIIDGVDNAGRKLTFMARATQLPGSTVNQIPVMYFGRELKFAGNRTFPEWTITVINDEDFLVRKAFEQWLSGLNAHAGNVREREFVNNAAYTNDAYIRQFNKAGNEVIKEYKFIGLFPIDVSPIEMDWGANDQIEEFAVTFAYQWWEDAQGITTDISR